MESSTHADVGTRSIVALLRHGQASDYGAASGPDALSERGALEAGAARAFLSALHPERILASPSARAQATAALVDGRGRVQLADALAGLRLGRTDEGPLAEVEQMDRVFADPTVAPFGGESLDDLAARVLAPIADLLASGANALAVAHRIVNVVAIADLLDLPLADAATLQQDTGGVNLLERRRTSSVVAGINLTPADPLLTDPRSRTLPDSTTAVDRRVYLIRHGEATNVGDDGALVAHPPAALTERGLRQADAVGELLARAGVRTVYASDIPRAAATGERIARGGRLELDRGFREVALGSADGTSVQELFARYPDYLTDPDAAPPGGESSQAAAERGLAAFSRIIGEDSGETIAIVGHGGINRALVGALLGWPMKPAFSVRCDFASVTILDHAGGRWWLRCLNWTPGGIEDLWRLKPIPELDDRHGALVGR